MTTLPPALLAAYCATHYQVFSAEGTVTLRVGVASSLLQALHRQHDVACSGFLTAWNPYGNSVTSEENEAAQTALLEELKRLRLAFLPGVGIDPESDYPGEESILALGLTRDEAIRLGNQYHQNAIVWTGSDAIPELILLK